MFVRLQAGSVFPQQNIDNVIWLKKLFCLENCSKCQLYRCFAVELFFGMQTVVAAMAVIFMILFSKIMKKLFSATNG